MLSVHHPCQYQVGWSFLMKQEYSENPDLLFVSAHWQRLSFIPFESITLNFYIIQSICQTGIINPKSPKIPIFPVLSLSYNSVLLPVQKRYSDFPSAAYDLHFSTDSGR
jgi:hypothetical protein